MAYRVSDGDSRGRIRGTSLRRFSNAFYLIIAVLCAAGFLLYNRDQHLASPVQNERIALISFVTQEQPYMYRSLRDKQKYATRHGYQFLMDYEADDEMGVLWHKFTQLERAVASGKYDWVWWIDFDSLIMNHETRLSNIIRASLRNSTTPDEIHALFTPDCWCLNAGSMIFRSNAWTLDFLSRVRRVGMANRKLSEQDAIHHLIFGDNWESDECKLIEKHVMVVPQKVMNAFPDENGCVQQEPLGNWRKGDFIIHFAGAWSFMTEPDPVAVLMNRYAPLMIT